MSGQLISLLSRGSMDQNIIKYSQAIQTIQECHNIAIPWVTSYTVKLSKNNLYCDIISSLFISFDDGINKKISNMQYYKMIKTVELFVNGNSLTKFTGRELYLNN